MRLHESYAMLARRRKTTGAPRATRVVVRRHQFFVRLIHHTHQLVPPAAGGRLGRWWFEQAAAAFLGIHPDGHLLWTTLGRTVGAFVEGAEDLPRVADKLAAYARLAASGRPLTRGPVRPPQPPMRGPPAAT